MPLSLSPSPFSFRWISSSLLAVSPPRASRAAGGGGGGRPRGGGGDRPSVVMVVAVWCCGGNHISSLSCLLVPDLSRSRSRLRWSVSNPSLSHETLAVKLLSSFSLFFSHASLSPSPFSFRWISSSLLAASPPRASRAAGGGRPRGGGGDRPSVVMVVVVWCCGGDQISSLSCLLVPDLFKSHLLCFLFQIQIQI
ncbi:hypothetical protein IGI04_039983 [Brassica rapa subsp. trilocularis]|uniref:Uncharacterized protein n=1 Tax=Brassica rapa subsp. trilocularis TaxID=1813537 RepID=A0ABQ7KN57_BRACM|nr:hypothetical protein IGI04_039983 [Brassica rapa subsp. trilocularis]